MRLPPGLAASTTTRVIALLPPPPLNVLELGFAGIHAVPLRLSGYEVTVVEPDPELRDSARERAGPVLDKVPPRAFGAVVAPDGFDLAGVESGVIVLVGQDGSVWQSPPGTTSSAEKSSPT